MPELKPASLLTITSFVIKITARQLRGTTGFQKQWTEPHLREQPEKEKRKYDYAVQQE